MYEYFLFIDYLFIFLCHTRIYYNLWTKSLFASKISLFILPCEICAISYFFSFFLFLPAIYFYILILFFSCSFPLGIGDRHAQNVLIDTLTGELVQIDFGIVLEQGKTLATPETVPFRLTRYSKWLIFIILCCLLLFLFCYFMFILIHFFFYYFISFYLFVFIFVFLFFIFLIFYFFNFYFLFFIIFRDVVDGLGISGCEGTFRKSSEQVLRVLRENKLQVRTS